MMQSEALGRDVMGERRGRGDELASAERTGLPSKSLFGVLPIRRIIPQDVHSVMDYAGGIAVAFSALTSRKRKVRLAGAVLGGSIVGVSLLTDYRLSAAKVIPIEVHEALDYVWGASAIAAPFVLGYSRRARGATLVQVLSGASTIVDSLFTDYRAVRGVGRRAGRRMSGGPRSRPFGEGARMSEVGEQRLSSPSTGFESG